MPLTTTLISPPACVNVHDPPERRRDPVHVLRAGVHRDLRARGHGEPLARHAELLGEIERGDHAAALRLGERAERPGRVAEQRHPQHALGIALCAVADQPDDDACAVRCRRPVDRRQRAVSLEVVLDELAGWDDRPWVGAPRREHLDDLGRMDRATATGGDDPLGALVERLQRLGRRGADLDHDVAAAGIEHAQRHVPLAAVLAHPAAQHDQLEAEAGRLAGEAGDDRAGLLGTDVDRRPGVEQQAVPQQTLARRPARLGGAHRLERVVHHPLELRQRRDAAVLVAHRREVADLGDGDETLVALRSRARRRGTGRRPASRGAVRARSSTAATAPSARPSSGAGRARRVAPRIRRRGCA